MEIEVFRAGNAAAEAAGITAADLADVASFDCAANPIAHVMGHPMSDTPALGPIRKFIARGASLFADVDETSPGFAKVKDGVKAGTILNRSMMFFGKGHKSNPTPGKLAPKHLGWLGGAAPGVAGMKPLSQCLAFAAEGDTIEITGDPAEAVTLDPKPTGVVSFADESTPPKGPNMADAETDEAKAIRVEREKLDAEKLQFAADQATARAAANTATVERLVAESKVLPADKDDLVAAFNAVDGGELIAFASDDKKPKASPLSIITAIMSKGGKVTPAGDGQAAPEGEAPQFDAAEGTLAEVRKAKVDKYNK